MKKHICVLTAAFLGLSVLLGGCGGQTGGAESSPAQTSAQAQEESQQQESGANDSGESQASEAAQTDGQSQADSAGETEAADPNAIRVGSLNGPTSMGLAKLMDEQAGGEASQSYAFTMAGKADELVGKIANGDLDIALLPANVASVLYSKTQGNVKVIDINTLGVLYVVASDDSISSISDLKGKTLYMTGKGTTPEYVMNYLLEENGLTASDVTLEFKSEAAEVASVLKEDPTAIGVLPQPFATAACIQNENLKTVLDLTEQWNILNGDTGSMLVTGVTIVRSDYLAENEEAVKQFIEDHQASASYTQENPADAAELVAAQGIVEKAAIAQKALPYYNIVCLTGTEMKDALEGYLEVLFEQDPQSVGGNLPGEDFYYIP